MTGEMNQEVKYSNREIDKNFSIILEKLDAIHAQTSKTNGRVTKLEGDTGKLQGWRTGIVMCIMLFGFIVIPLIVYAYATDKANTQREINLLQKSTLK